MEPTQGKVIAIVVIALLLSSCEESAYHSSGSMFCSPLKVVPMTGMTSNFTASQAFEPITPDTKPNEIGYYCTWSTR